jgi:hypothetical protein
MTTVRAKPIVAPPTAAAEQRWLVFVHQLPARPSNARVKTWRRLQQIGAVPVRNGVYVLPNTAQTVEDFEWLRGEVVALGGQANIFQASSISGLEEQQIIKQFQLARALDFKRLKKQIEALRRELAGRPFPSSGKALHELRTLRERLEGLQRIDFFQAPGRSVVEGKLRSIDGGRRKQHRHLENSAGRLHRRDYQHRTWITRPRPGVDRFASAWLIRRFIDGSARFVFGSSPEKHPDAIPFDMYQSGGFKHEGEQCTFEVLVERFGVADVAVRAIGEIVHDLDLKAERFQSPHAPTIGALVEGLRASIADDDRLLDRGIGLFEALYQSLEPNRLKRRRNPKIC